MEILGIGDKIRRARIYKGLTLRELCSDKLSVSKLSCIENNKIKPDSQIIKYLADRLNMNIEYFKQDVKEQIANNIEKILKNPDSRDFEKELIYNLDQAVNNNVYDYAFKILHYLQDYYIRSRQLEKFQVYISKYYDISQKINSIENQLIYLLDMGRFLFAAKEYQQAANYFGVARKKAHESKHYKELANASYNETICYLMMEDYKKAYEISSDLDKLIKYFDNDYKKAQAYETLTVLAIRMDKQKFKYYEEKSLKLYANNESQKADLLYNIASIEFELKMNKEAEDYIKRAISIYPKEDKVSFTELLLDSTDILVKNGMNELAKSLCDEALNSAIDVNNIMFIEKGYHLKSIILENQNDYEKAEIYMNLSLDSLLKFGSNEELYKRYMELGSMYFKLNNVSEALKYFNIAEKIKHKI